MELKEFKKGIVIYKSHKLKNNFISVTYANKLSLCAVSTEKTIEIEDKGGALTSLHYYLCNRKFKCRKIG